METGMTPAAKNNSCLPWVVLLAAIIVCLFCAVCSLGGTGLYWLSRSSASSATAVSALPPSSGPETWRQTGNAKAKVVVEEFADFQCPYCGQFSAHGEPKLRTEYIQTGKILFIFRNYPILDGNQSGGDSISPRWARYARESRESSEIHDTLYETIG